MSRSGCNWLSILLATAVVGLVAALCMLFWQHAWLSVQVAFAEEQTGIFDEMRVKAVASDNPTTAVTALFCSSVFQKTATSLISTYMIIAVMFMAPVAVKYFAQTFFQGTSEAAIASKVGVLSPFSATFALPLDVESSEGATLNSAEAVAAAKAASSDLRIFFGYVGWTILYNAVLILVMIRLFQVRWRVAD